jgi:glycosyltransferase involved in cell wall biosynthesis
VAIHVGRLAPEKNLATVFEAYAAMKRTRPDVRLVLVGDGPDRGALRAAHPDCIFTGIRTGEDLAAHYASGDIFLFPSLTETFGNVTVEAMASGLAVIAYEYAAAAEHMQRGRNGVLAKYGDTQEFVTLAAQLVDDPIRIAACGRHARETAVSFDWTHAYADFIAALSAVIAAHDDGTFDGACLSA